MSQQDEPDRYLGTWELLPELCLYDEGEPPERATYEITQDEGEVHVRIRWQPRGSSEVLEAAFAGPPTGEVQPVPGSAEVTGLSLRRVDHATLDSAAWVGTRVVASARRAASADGALLLVQQQDAPPDGPVSRKVQVYRRAGT